MSEETRLKFLDRILARLHHHGLLAVILLLILVGGAMGFLWIAQSKQQADLEHCRERSAEYREIMDRRMTAAEKLAQTMANAADVARREVQALRSENSETKKIAADTNLSVKELVKKFIPK